MEPFPLPKTGCFHLSSSLVAAAFSFYTLACVGEQTDHGTPPTFMDAAGASPGKDIAVFSSWRHRSEHRVVNLSRRQFVSSAPAILGGVSLVSACERESDPQGYEAIAARTWRGGAMVGAGVSALSEELVRCATLAPSSHNTQCWKFAIEDKAITILPDLSRRCPAVDPDDHHLFVSLGCAAENLIHAASAHGLQAECSFDATRDGLFSAASGSPSIPTRLGELAFRWIVTPRGENDKYARQIRRSAGIAVFFGQAADKAHWVDVGRCYERFALQATALGIRNAFLNQPVEVRSVRPQFAAALRLADQRPDLVVRFGRGPRMPLSLRRPVQSVLV